MRGAAGYPIFFAVFCLLAPGAAMAQLKTCDRSRETVAVVEDTESAARLKEVGLASGISPVVRDVLRRSGCFAQDANASLKFRVSVTSISDEPVSKAIVVSTSARLANDEWRFEGLGRGQANPGPKTAKADAYAAAVTSAVEDAVNNVIEAHDRATSH